MISFEHKGDFKKTLTFLERASRLSIDNVLHRYGREGVNALSQATPVDTGQTARSWNYEIENVNGSYSIYRVNRVSLVPHFALKKPGIAAKIPPPAIAATAIRISRGVPESPV